MKIKPLSRALISKITCSKLTPPGFITFRVKRLWMNDKPRTVNHKNYLPAQYPIFFDQPAQLAHRNLILRWAWFNESRLHASRSCAYMFFDKMAICLKLSSLNIRHVYPRLKRSLCYSWENSYTQDKKNLPWDHVKLPLCLEVALRRLSFLARSTHDCPCMVSCTILRGQQFIWLCSENQY